MTAPDPSSQSAPGSEPVEDDLLQGPPPAAGGPPSPGPGDAGPPPGPDAAEEELQRAWEEQLKHVTVTDVLVQTAVTLVNLAGRRLGLGPDGEQERDLEEVRDGIDAVRALVPVLERGDVGHTLKPLRDALAQLQFEYAKLAARSGTPPPPQPPALAVRGPRRRARHPRRGRIRPAGCGCPAAELRVVGGGRRAAARTGTLTAVCAGGRRCPPACLCSGGPVRLRLNTSSAL